MTTRRLAVVSAGLSVPSSTRLLADRLAAAGTTALGRRDRGAEVEVVELRELAHELVDRTLTGFAAPRLDAAIQAVTGADGLIAVTPVFSGSYNGLFAAPEDWGGGDAATVSLGARIDRAGGELADMVAARPAAAPADPFADLTPFAQLLQGAAP